MTRNFIIKEIIDKDKMDPYAKSEAQGTRSIVTPYIETNTLDTNLTFIYRRIVYFESVSFTVRVK